MAFLLKRLCLQPSTRRNVLLQTRNLILVPQDDNRPVKTITEVIDELSMSVIGGPTSYDPEEYNKRRQDLLQYVPNSQVKVGWPVTLRKTSWA